MLMFLSFAIGASDNTRAAMRNNHTLHVAWVRQVLPAILVRLCVANTHTHRMWVQVCGWFVDKSLKPAVCRAFFRLPTKWAYLVVVCCSQIGM